MPATTDFLKNLKRGDKVLICSKAGRKVHYTGTVCLCASDTVWVSLSTSGIGLEEFSAETGKARGRNLFVHPYNEARAQEFLAPVGL